MLLFFLDKMACEMCQNDEIFNKTFTEFESRRGVVVFLLNIVLNIQELGVKLFCHCENVTDFCDFCKVFKKYKNIQYLSYENLLKFNFLEKFAQNLYTDLYNLRKKDAHLICCLIKKN